MRLLIPTFLILIGLALNHAWHGMGCWGYQPGGEISSLLYYAQSLASIYAIIGTAVYCFRDLSIRNLMFAATAMLMGIVAFYLISHSSMNTSVHNQGPENLIPFFANSLVAIIVGIQVMTEPKPPIRLASDCPACGYPLRQLPKRICPECGNESKVA